MANNVIDELSLNISANANSALSNLTRLQGGLRNLAKTVGTVSSANASLSKTFSALNHINVGSLGKAINELERLEKINLKNLDGKTIKLDIKINGADEAERKIYAMQDAVKNFDIRPFSKQMKSAMGLDSVDAKKFNSVLRQAVSDMGKGISPSKSIASWLGDIEKSGLSVAKASFREDIAAMESEYNRFLQYIRTHKISTTQGIDRGILRQNLDPSEYKTYFSQSGGTALDTRWDDLIAKFPTIMSNLRQVEGEAERVYAVLDKIREAKDATTGRANILDLKGSDSDNAFDTLLTKTSEIANQMQQQFNSAVNTSMRESANKIPLDVKIDPSRIEKQISAAIKQASGKTYNLPVKFDINTGAMKTTIATALGNVDVSSMGQLSEHLKAAATSLSQIGTLNPKESGLTGFVNSMARLASVDMSKFSGGAMESIVGTISQISSVEDISASINRLVSSLARLANAGESTKAVEANLRPLGNAIKDVMSRLSSAGGLPSEITAFVSSLAQLANAGNKTAATAGHLEELGVAIRNFMVSMQNAPAVSGNVLTMVQSLGQIASAGNAAGTAARSLNRNMNSTSATSSRAAAGFSLVGDALKMLEPAYNRVTSAAKTLLKSGFQKITSGLNPSSLVVPFKNLGNAINSVTGNVKMLMTTMLGLRGVMGIFNGIKNSIMQGADVTEIDHIVESVFSQNMVGYVQEWAHSAIEQFGIAENAAKRMAGTFSAMFQASKIGQNDAGKMAMDLTGLAGDLSAFYNIDTETAFNKIRSGMAGMVRPLRDLGIDLTAATLQEYALAQGITTSYSAMSQAEKVMLRYNYLMSVTKTQQGDFGRTSLSLANSLRTLKAYASAVSTQIGVGFGSALRHVIVLLNKVMKYVLKAASAFATFMQTLFGKYKGGASGMAVDMSMAEEATDGLSDASGGAADGLGEAADNAKKLKKELAVLPFDELNQLNKDMDTASTGSGGGGGGGGVGGGGGIGDGLLDWGDMLGTSKLPDAISEWADRIKAAFKAKDWEALGAAIAWGINKGIDKLYDVLDPAKFKAKVYPFINAFTRTFNSLIDNIHWNKLGKTLGRGINNLVWTLNKLIEGINWTNMGKKFAEGANGLVEEVDFRAIGNLIGNKFMIAWNVLYGFAYKFDWAMFGQKLGDGINGINDKIRWARVAAALMKFVDGIFESIKNLVETVQWHEIGKNIAAGLNQAIYMIHGEDWGKSLGSLINKILDEVNYIISSTNWVRLGEQIALFLQEIPWGKILYTVAHAIVSALGGILKGMMKTPAGAMAAGLFVALNAVKIGSALNPFISKIITAFTGKNVVNPMGQEVYRSLLYAQTCWSGGRILGQHCCVGRKSICDCDSAHGNLLRAIAKRQGTAL